MFSSFIIANHFHCKKANWNSKSLLAFLICFRNAFHSLGYLSWLCFICIIPFSNFLHLLYSFLVFIFGCLFEKIMKNKMEYKSCIDHCLGFIHFEISKDLYHKRDARGLFQPWTEVQSGAQYVKDSRLRSLLYFFGIATWSGRGEKGDDGTHWDRDACRRYCALSEPLGWENREGELRATRATGHNLPRKRK